MKLPVQKNRIGFLLGYLLLGMVFIYNWFSIPNEYQMNYAVLFIDYLIVGGVTFYFYSSGMVKLFEPFQLYHYCT